MTWLMTVQSIRQLHRRHKKHCPLDCNALFSGLNTMLAVQPAVIVRRSSEGSNRWRAAIRNGVVAVMSAMGRKLPLGMLDLHSAYAMQQLITCRRSRNSLF